MLISGMGTRFSGSNPEPPTYFPVEPGKPELFNQNCPGNSRLNRPVSIPYFISANLKSKYLPYYFEDFENVKKRRSA